MNTSHLLIELKRGSVTSTGEFEAYASTFNGSPDLVGDIISPGAFNEALKTHERFGSLPALLWNHNEDIVLGKWLEFKQDSHGLLGRGKLTLGVQKASDTLELIRDKAVAFSIRFMVGPNGSTTHNGIRTIHNIVRLDEVSILPIPANPRAQVTQVKKSPRNFEKALRTELGLSVREARRATAQGFKGLVCDKREINMQDVCERVDRLLSVIENERGL